MTRYYGHPFAIRCYNSIIIGHYNEAWMVLPVSQVGYSPGPFKDHQLKNDMPHIKTHDRRGSAVRPNKMHKQYAWTYKKVLWAAFSVNYMVP
jgi:hypothetical protein